MEVERTELVNEVMNRKEMDFRRRYSDRAFKSPYVAGRGAFGMWLFSDIKIGHRNESYQEIYRTTIHELGHAAHWKLAGDWIVGNNYKKWLGRTN